jgi:hypothetical protein
MDPDTTSSIAPSLDEPMASSIFMRDEDLNPLSAQNSVHDDAALASRLEKNKIAQRQFRARRKEYISRLEHQVKSMGAIQGLSKNLAARNQHLSFLLGKEKAMYDRDRHTWAQEKMDMLRTIHMLQYQVHDLNARLYTGPPGQMSAVNPVPPPPLPMPGKLEF